MATKKAGTKKAARKKAAPAPAPRALTAKERTAWAALDRFAACIAPAAAHELRAAVAELLGGPAAGEG